MTQSDTDRAHTPTVIEPAPWCKDALFVVTTFGDGECAILVRGWEALCAKVVEVHFHDPEPAQREEILNQLVDWEEWACEGDGYPYHFQWFYEDGSVSATRVTDDETRAPHDALMAALRDARVFVQMNVDELLSSCCLTGADGKYDRSTIDHLDKSAIDDAESCLAKIDAALAGGAVMSDQEKIRRELAGHRMRKSSGNSWKMVDRPNGWLSYRVTWAPGIVTVSGQLGTASYEVWPSFGTLWGAIDLISHAGHDYLVGKSGAQKVFDREKTVVAILRSADEAMREWKDFSLWERIVREWGHGGNHRNGAEQMRAASYMRDSCEITEESIWRIFEWESVPMVMEYEYSTYQQYEAVRLWAATMLAREPAHHSAWRWWLRELDHARSVKKRGILFRPDLLDAKVHLNGSRWWMRAQRGDRQYFASVSNLRLFGINLARLGFFTAGGSSFSNLGDASRFEQCDWRKAVQS